MKIAPIEYGFCNVEEILNLTTNNIFNTNIWESIKIKIPKQELQNRKQNLLFNILAPNKKIYYFEYIGELYNNPRIDNSFYLYVIKFKTKEDSQEFVNLIKTGGIFKIVSSFKTDKTNQVPTLSEIYDRFGDKVLNGDHKTILEDNWIDVSDYLENPNSIFIKYNNFSLLAVVYDDYYGIKEFTTLQINIRNSEISYNISGPKINCQIEIVKIIGPGENLNSVYKITSNKQNKIKFFLQYNFVKTNKASFVGISEKLFSVVNVFTPVMTIDLSSDTKSYYNNKYEYRLSDINDISHISKLFNPQSKNNGFYFSGDGNILSLSNTAIKFGTNGNLYRLNGNNFYKILDNLDYIDSDRIIESVDRKFITSAEKIAIQNIQTKINTSSWLQPVANNSELNSIQHIIGRCVVVKNSVDALGGPTIYISDGNKWVPQGINTVPIDSINSQKTFVSGSKLSEINSGLVWKRFGNKNQFVSIGSKINEQPNEKKFIDFVPNRLTDINQNIPGNNSINIGFDNACAIDDCIVIGTNSTIQKQQVTISSPIPGNENRTVQTTLKQLFIGNNIKSIQNQSNRNIHTAPELIIFGSAKQNTYPNVNSLLLFQNSFDGKFLELSGGVDKQILNKKFNKTLNLDGLYSIDGLDSNYVLLSGGAKHINDFITRTSIDEYLKREVLESSKSVFWIKSNGIKVNDSPNKILLGDGTLLPQEYFATSASLDKINERLTKYEGNNYVVPKDSIQKVILTCEKNNSSITQLELDQLVKVSITK